MKKNNLLLFLLLLCASVAAQLDEFDENALFSDTAMIEVHDTNSVPVEKASIVEKLRTSIGGEIIGASEIVSTREFTDEPGLNNTFMLNRLVGS